MPIITNITKEGQEFLLHMSDRDSPIRINVVTKDITSYTGRVVKSFPSRAEFDHNDKLSTRGFQILIEGLRHIKSNDMWYKQKVITGEKFFVCLDRLDETISECPKGYLKWIMENNLRINRETLADFKWSKKSKNFSENDKDIINGMYKYIGNWSGKFDYDEWKMFIRIYKTQIKEDVYNQFSIGRNMCSFANLYGGFVKEMRDTIRKDVVDTNRNFEYNSNLIENWKNKDRNERIIEQENKIRDISNLENNEFCVIVPQVMEDFTREGEQQNNCVGYYYHDSISMGNDLIYFIRRKSNPDKSYITCRFNVYTGRTVEARRVNNNSVNNNYASRYIDEIDEMIRKLIGNN